MTASVAGSLLLVLVGVGFWCAALVTWWRLGDDPAARTRRRLGMLVDVLVGAVAIADGTISVLGEPERILVWSLGSAALLGAVTLLVLRHRRELTVRPSSPFRGRSSSITVAGRSSPSPASASRTQPRRRLGVDGELLAQRAEPRPR